MGTVSLPADFTPLPQIYLVHARQAFVARSLEILGKMIGQGSYLPDTTSGGAGMPFIQINDPIFANGGQFIDRATMIRSLNINRRDVTSNAGIVENKITGVNNKGIVLNRRSDLMAFTDDVYIQGLSAEELNAELGKQAGEMVADDLCTTFVSTLIGAVEAFTTTTHVKSVWSDTVPVNLSPSVIDQGRFVLGDRYDALTHILVHSSAHQDMRTHATQQAYTGVGNLALQGVDTTNYQGLIPTKRDDPLLITTESNHNLVKSFLLGAQVLEFGFYRPVTMETIRVINRETKTTQARWDYDLWIRCTSRSYTDTGANPTNTSLATSGNWTDNTSSHKELAAVELQHNASAY